MRRLTIPAALAVATLGSLSCTESTAPPTDAARPDATVADAGSDRPDPDACPDPKACFGDFKFIDGSTNPVYHYVRDGSFSEVPCPPAPEHCPIA